MSSLKSRFKREVILNKKDFEFCLKFFNKDKIESRAMRIRLIYFLDQYKREVLGK
jgi:hypothetical protein